MCDEILNYLFENKETYVGIENVISGDNFGDLEYLFNECIDKLETEGLIVLEKSVSDPFGKITHKGIKLIETFGSYSHRENKKIENENQQIIKDLENKRKDDAIRNWKYFREKYFYWIMIFSAVVGYLVNCILDYLRGIH